MNFRCWPQMYDKWLFVSIRSEITNYKFLRSKLNFARRFSLSKFRWATLLVVSYQSRLNLILWRKNSLFIVTTMTSSSSDQCREISKFEVDFVLPRKFNSLIWIDGRMWVWRKNLTDRKKNNFYSRSCVDDTWVQRFVHHMRSEASNTSPVCRTSVHSKFFFHHSYGWQVQVF